MKKNKTDIVNEKNFDKHFSYLDEKMKSRSNKIIRKITYNIEKYKKHQKKLNTDTEENENFKKYRKKSINKLRKTIKSGEYIDEFDNKKLIIEYYYNEKKDKLIINDIYLYKKILTKKSFFKRELYNIIHCLFFAVNFLTYFLIAFTKGSSLNGKKMLCLFFVIYVILGGLFLFCRFKDDFLKDYRLEKLGGGQYYKTENYISNKENIIFFIELGYLFSQLILSQATIVHEFSQPWNFFILIIALSTDIYFFINIFHVVFKLSRVKGLFFVLWLTVIFILGLVEKDTWIAVALVIAIISLLTSEDIWVLYQDDSPLSARYNTLANKNIVTKNIFNLKLTVATSVLILYLSVLFFDGKHYFLKFFNMLANTISKIGENDIRAKLFDGLDKLVFISIVYLFYIIINKSFIKHRDTTLLKEIVTPVSSIIYNKIDTSKLDLIDNYDELSEENIKEYPELIIYNSKYIPEGTKFLIEEHKNGDILKIVYPDKEIEVIKLNNLKKLSAKDK
ncbi:hypothetical protein Q4433_08485 [Streptococcus parasanguinis]|uniref:hypothetical protein n=2 Tax=Streptococcus TaxID=1301 RepID=UPI0026E11AD3|nr:hypothetical protein [Streptococcus parasanguinis]MDO6230881.1 hypothetical protein [Streptococcus parasanguinis]